MHPSSSLLLLLSGPSGSGKTTLSQRLQKEQEFFPSISATTRAPRANETHGKDYYFLSKEEFQHNIQVNNFLEFAEVHGNFYGTLASEVIKPLQEGKHIVMDIDIQGAQLLRKHPNSIIQQAMVDVFISPANTQELAQRLSGRGTDSDEIIQERLKNALKEASFWHEYQYAIASKSHEEDWKRLLTILAAEKLSTKRQHFCFNSNADYTNEDQL